ncbi:RNA polymerase sigma-70 factor (ECF subfamily) [Hamadaea flava]|uniref:RNA polymerase sigma factor n=1 Tax=Hamadaea flava TaxID=1742688 RepID=A0ABV8LJT9_9ACTN|nr:RNA polymerase sigma factor [Hamadaea flava]MCP2325267.1 RNA polymerase sigma-70 factor (ECF subfamily) [Hamadaea flava]
MTHPSAREHFAALFHRHHRQVYAYAVSRAGRGVADDIVNDTFLVAWRRLDAVPLDPLPWLLGVARNVVYEKHRDQVRQLSLMSQAKAAVEGDVADLVAERSATLAALDALTPADRELLTLVAWHGLAARDAAKVLGVSTATFFVRLHRARRRFEKALAEQSAVESALPLPAEEIRR